MAPAVKRLLPPASSSGARSSTSTETPCSAAASAAHRAALPPPTTTTSAEAGSMPVSLLVHLAGANTTRDRLRISRYGNSSEGLPLSVRGRNAILALVCWNAGKRTAHVRPRHDLQSGPSALERAVGQDQGDGTQGQGPARHDRRLCRLARRRPGRGGGSLP